MITGAAIGYLIGILVMFGITVIFGVCSAANAYEGDLSKIYDPETLDFNAENDNPAGDEENGRRTNPETDGPDTSSGDQNK